MIFYTKYRLLRNISFLSENAEGAKDKDLKEFYHYYPWGQCPEFLSDATARLYKQLNGLAMLLLDWVVQESPKAIRAAAHEDINFLTCLVASTEPGLQVKDLEGNWHDVECDPRSIAVR